MKKIIALLIGAIIVITMSLTAFAADEPEFIEVSTPEGLKAINADLKANYLLTSNIDLTGFEWDSIGTDPFEGILEGNGHIIFGLTCEAYMNKVGGLFMENKGIIRNLCLAGVKITTAGEFDSIGAICGDNLGTIDNCHVEGLMEMGLGSYIGFIAGYNNNVIKNCSAAGVINASYHMGGLVGQNKTLGTVMNSVNYADATALHNRVGGIIGTVQTNTGAEYAVLNALNYGDMKSLPCTDSTSHGSTGGIIGHYQRSGCPVENCANLGLVTGAACKSVITGSATVKDEVKNVYYLEGTVADPTIIDASVEAGIMKSSADFLSGAVTSLLGSAFKNNTGADSIEYPILIAGYWETGFSSVNYYDARELVGITDMTTPAAVGTATFKTATIQTTAAATTTPAPVEATTVKPEETTATPDNDTTANAPVGTTVASASTTASSKTENKKGCGSSSAMLVQLAVMLAGGLVFTIKKK